MVGLGVATVTTNASSALVCMPSDTLMTMFGKVPAWLGVPESSPVAVLNDAHEGWFATEKVSAVPLAALVVGLKS